MKKKGFTLIEILLVVAMMAVLAGLTFPAYQVMYARNELDVAANVYVQAIRRAQVLSRAQKNNEFWGAHIQPSRVTVFQGESYEGRNVDYDEIFELSQGVEVAGLQEINFRGIYGLPLETGQTLLTTPDSASRTITINHAGVPDF